MKKQLGVLLGCGVTATALVAINVLPADEAVATGLVSFGACSDVLDHLKVEARERVGPWGLPGGGNGRGWAVPEADGAERTLADAPAGDSAGEAPGVPTGSTGSYSTTNVQEIGVDEPDVVKTDGQRIVTTIGGTLRVIDTTGAAPREVGQLKLSDQYADATLLLHGDWAMVFVRTYQTLMDYGTAGPAADAAADAVAPAPGKSTPTTAVLLVDLSVAESPTIVSTLDIDGSYLDARMVDQTVRLVVSAQPNLPFPLDERGQTLDEDELVERNRQVISESTIEDWLPSYRLDAAGGRRSAGDLVSCDQLNRPTDFAGFSTMSVLTLGFDHLSDGDAVGVLTDGDTVYASTDQLYVATAGWAEPADLPATDETRSIAPVPPVQRTGIHAFAIGGDGPAEYLASGEVEGQIIGRYAMSEHEGVLRVATTTNPADAEASESQLITLATQGDELVQVGRVGGLGEGEQIYAVRYSGDTGYVVTFRQTDPLYVLDLSDPTQPSMEGELKITGYSSYLHPIGDNRLIGVGQEATESGQTIGAQVSLFDVSTATAPEKLDGHVEQGVYSGAETDPHAFLYWPGTRQIVVPISGPGVRPMNDVAEPGVVEAGGALVLTVDGDVLSKRGVITHASQPANPGYWTSILRSLVIGDSLYTLWNDGLQVNNLNDLQLRSWLPISQER